MKLSIVIPAYNEEQAVASIIERCLAERASIIAGSPVDEVEIIVVSDGSTDRTPEIARTYEPAIQVIAYLPNRGYGAALKTGFAAASGELVSFLDADGTCDPAYFTPMVNKLFEEHADIAIGSRMGPDSKMPKVRRVGNRIFRSIIGWLGNTQITDSASGMRVIRRDRLKDIYPLPDGLHFTPAMSCRAVLDSRLRIVEVDMRYEERVGRSKLGVIKDGLRFLRVILDIALTYRPLRFFGFPAVVLLLLALFYGVGLIVSYARLHAIGEGMFYRMAAVTAMGIAGAQLLILGILADRISSLLHNQTRPRWWVSAGALRCARGRWLVVAAAVLLGAGLFANRKTISEYMVTGHIDVHWSFVAFGLFAVLLAFQLLGYAVMDYMIELFAERQLATASMAEVQDRVPDV